MFCTPHPEPQLLNPHSMHILHPSVTISFDLHEGHILS